MCQPGNKGDDYIEGYCPALSSVEFEFNESGASLWKPLRAYAAFNPALEGKEQDDPKPLNTRIRGL